MNKLEAKISLFAITFFAGIQYVFLSNVPSSVSSFAFLSVTNFFGFLITLAAFSSELFRLNRKQVLQSILLAVEMFLFNVFLLLGSSSMDPAVTSFTLTGYLVFLPVIYLILRQKVAKASLIGVVAVLLGLVLALEADPARFADPRILFLIAADICFALYIITIERYCASSNPSILAMGRMFFCFVLAFVCWMAESLFSGKPPTLPTDAPFWSSVMFISFFVCGLYNVVQIYAQRYVSGMETALIFSTESVITLLMAPLLARLSGATSEPVTPLKLLGCAVIIAGILLSDGSVRARLRPSREAAHEK